MALSVTGVSGRLGHGFRSRSDVDQERFSNNEKVRRELMQEMVSVFLDSRLIRGDEEKKIRKQHEDNIPDSSILLEDKKGSFFIITDNACKGDVQKMKQAGTQKLQWALQREEFPDYGQIRLPGDIVETLKSTEVRAGSIEFLITILDEINMMGQRGKIYFRRELNKNADRPYPSGFATREEWQSHYSNYHWKQIRVGLSKEPNVWVTKTGLSANIQIPDTVKNSLVGRKLGEIISVPIFGDKLIKTAIFTKNTTTLKLGK